MKPLLRHLILPVALTLPAGAQVVVQRVFNVGQTINDNGQYVDVRNIPSGGMTAITDVNVGLVMSGAPGSRMRLGDYFVSLTYGTASEDERVAVLLNRPQASDTRTWGSSLSSANLIAALNLESTAKLIRKKSVAKQMKRLQKAQKILETAV